MVRFEYTRREEVPNGLGGYVWRERELSREEFVSEFQARGARLPIPPSDDGESGVARLWDLCGVELTLRVRKRDSMRAEAQRLFDQMTPVDRSAYPGLDPQHVAAFERLLCGRTLTWREGRLLHRLCDDWCAQRS